MRLLSKALGLAVLATTTLSLSQVASASPLPRVYDTWTVRAVPGIVPQLRPHTLDYYADGDGDITMFGWKSWGPRSATGYGQQEVRCWGPTGKVAPTPEGCPGGGGSQDYYWAEVGVTLSRPMATVHGPVFTRMTTWLGEYFNGPHGYYQTITLYPAK